MTKYITLKQADKLNRVWSSEDYAKTLRNDQDEEDEELKELEEVLSEDGYPMVE